MDQRVPIVDFESVEEWELQANCDHFRAALEWASRRTKEGTRPDLMQMGWRMIAIIKVMMPELVGGMNLRVSPASLRELREVLGGADPAATGFFFRRVLVWVRKCVSLSQLGQRAYSMIYVLCGDLVDSITCQEIGAFTNSTRQAANKPIQDFRDTFSGIKSLPMRGEETRRKCRLAQLKLQNEKVS